MEPVLKWFCFKRPKFLAKDDYKAAGATRVVALVKEEVEKEVEDFRDFA